MPRLLLLAALLACTVLSGAATSGPDVLPDPMPSISSLGRKLKQTDAVCCLFGKNNNPPQCSQQNVNSPDARNTSQSGLVNVNGVYVNLGCIQVVANVQACVTVGTLIGNGNCIRRQPQLTQQAQSLVSAVTQVVQGLANQLNIPLLSGSALLPTGARGAAKNQPASAGTP